MLKRSRIIILVVLFFAVILCYIFQLMQYQVTDGASARAENSKSTVNTMAIIAPRGDILDRYGRVLATSKIGYNILIESAFFPSGTQKEKQDEELLALTAILSQKGETWEDSLPISRTAPYSFTSTDKTTSAYIATLIKYINDRNSSKDTDLDKNATAPQIMTALERIYKTENYPETQRRTLCGIRYEMVLKGYASARVFTFAQGVSIDTVTKIEERSSDLPGAVTQQVPVRYYPDGTIAPHVVGITGPIYADQLASYVGKGYSADDIIGKFGIESYMEQYLHGTNGSQQVEQNSNGDVTSTSIVDQPKPGDNVVLTLDKDLQVTLQNQLPQIVQSIKDESQNYKGHPGSDAQGAAVVVLNIKTGDVLAMATYPSFDLNTYKQNFSALNSDPLKPMFNRCIAGAYTPGSTFKPLVAVSGLMNGVITKDTTWYCPSSYTIGQGAGAYTGHDDENFSGSLNVEQAIEDSRNIFFVKLGYEGLKSIDKIEATAKIFGIGQKTGIELYGEAAGKMAGPQVKNPWYPGDLAQASFGQSVTLITPLQLANYVSTMVKGGTEYQVHIVRQVNSYDNSSVIVDNTKPTVKSKTAISDSVIQVVKEGMQKVTESGTASSVFDGFAMKVGGKTGTAQINLNYGYNGVFICFAPYDDPEIAVATVVEYGHNGYQTAPVAKTAISSYFGLNPQTGVPQVSTVQTEQVGTLLK
jgi:penicillin-binding protein 2